MVRPNFLVATCLGIFGITACTDSFPQDCAQLDPAKLTRCFDKEGTKEGERVMLLKCFPFSKPEKIEGLWVVGFEKNDFFELEKLPRPSIWSKNSGTELVLDENLLMRPDSTEAIEVSLIGRRSTCEFTKITPNLIIVDNIRILRKFKNKN